MLPQNDYLIQRDLLDYHLYPRHCWKTLGSGVCSTTPGSSLKLVSCQVCRSLWRLGHLLVTGLRLERRYAPVRLSHAG